MRKLTKTLISCTMAVVMMAMPSMTDLSQGLISHTATTARAAESSGRDYISEVKLGQGEDSSEASADLLAEGYTILTDDSGSYADLNENAGGDKGRKDGPKSKVVYLGYKRTNDPQDAVTDLAVMNMDGGYSVQKYEELVQRNMEIKIKPFMNEVVKILKEYRENLKQSPTSANRLRAEFSCAMLNKLTDDDCDGAQIGELLKNETRYEMGETAYAALSDSEKKKHADIITYFVQADERMLYCLTNALAKAADTSTEDTWLDRFQQYTYKQMEYEVIMKYPKLTTKADIGAKLDKLYEDDAKRILSHWGDLQDSLGNLNEAEEKVDSYDAEQAQEIAEETEEQGDDGEVDEELKEEAEDAAAETLEAVDAAVTLNVAEYLEGMDYEFEAGGIKGQNLLEFFSLDKSAFAGEGIRALYPMVDVLSEGQIAGLDYLSVRDLIAVGMNDMANYNNVDLDEMESISIFLGVNREIYEPGGVALTSDAMRKQAVKDYDPLEEETKWSFIWRYMAAGMAIFAAASFVFAFFYRAKFAGKALGVAGAVLTVIAVIFLIISFNMENDQNYDVSYKEIPNYMVDEVDITTFDAKGRKVMIKDQTAYYKSVRVNRKKGETDVEAENLRILGDRGDLNGDIGKQWLALYAVKFKSGTPILADSFKVVKDNSSLPSGYSIGIHDFGSIAVCNLNKKNYLFAENPTSIYVYYKTDDKPVSQVSGSIFSVGSLAIGGGIGLAVGAILGFMVALAYRRRKKESGGD